MSPDTKPRLGACVRRCIAATLFALACMPASATQVVPHNLTQLIGRADLIVAGTVTSVTDGLEGGLPYTEVTVTVSSSAKKKLRARSQFKFRQFGLLKPRRMADGRFLLGAAPEGFAHWRKDEQVIAFLYKPAARTGLRTTVGLEQGKFTTQGGRTANAYFNRGLFRGVQVTPGVLSAGESRMLAQAGGDIDAQALLSLVNRAVAGQWIERGVMR